MSQINSYIPFFPNAAVLSKYSEEELLNILEFAVPPHWRKAFDLRDYLPTSDDKAVLSKYSEEELLNILEFAVPPHWRKAFDLRDYLPTSDDKVRFISECERVERNETPSDDDCTSNKNPSLQNLKKVARKQIRILRLCIAPTARWTTHVTEV
jgi:hypothetical protein